jgi:hypothetical protein
MPNDSRSRRDKKEKEKKRKDPKPLRKELPAEEAEATSTDVDGIHSEEALAIFVSLLGAKPSGEAMENSLPLPLCPLQQKRKIRQRRRGTARSLKVTAKMIAKR